MHEIFFLFPPLILYDNFFIGCSVIFLTKNSDWLSLIKKVSFIKYIDWLKKRSCPSPRKIHKVHFSFFSLRWIALLTL